VSYLTPLTYVIDALREAMMVPSTWFAIDLLVLLAWVIVLQAVAVIVLNKKMQY
jgi:ABC-type multidrug transport system permease subunit